MKINSELDDQGDHQIVITEAFSGVLLRQPDGNELGICMRDGGFEINVIPKGSTERSWHETDMVNATIFKCASLSPSEALYGFMGWLTSREEVTKLGADQDCAGIPELIEEFIQENNLAPVREGNWTRNLTHPGQPKEEDNHTGSLNAG